MNYFDILLAKKLEDDRDPKVEGLSVSENGRYHEDGVVYDPVIVNVPQTPLSKLTVTENGTYTAPSGTAYNEVEVDVPLPENAYLLKDIENTPTAIATFSDGANLPMPKLEVGIEPVQSGSGDPSPTNIRPISGWDEVNVTVADDLENPTTSNVYTIDLDGIRYGGKLDAVNGVLTITDGFISSYNGETLPSTWISDRDVYAEGTTPTIGAEVVYELATPLTIQLTPTPVISLDGVNNLWADSGDVIDGKYFSKEE